MKNSFFPTLSYGSNDRPKFTGPALDIMIGDAIQSPLDASLWEPLLSALSAMDTPLALIKNAGEARIDELRQAFFTYVENRDVVRGAAILAMARTHGCLHVDTHGERVRSLVQAEVAQLSMVLSITGLSHPEYFCFLGSGSAPESLLHIRQSVCDGLLPPIAAYYGIDNRETATTTANTLFKHLGLSDCRALTMKAEDFRPHAGTTGIMLTAAYLHPAKANILDAVCAQITGDTILIVRNMAKGQAVFSESAVPDDRAQKITTALNEPLGVRSDFYLVPAP